MKTKIVVALFMLGSVGYGLRRLGLHWGATEAEVHRSLPGDELVPEYGPLEWATFVLSFNTVFTVVYPQLKDLDFTTQANQLKVPVYLLAGHADVNAMSSLTEHYYMVLRVPHKELIWFKSGHSMNDSDLNQFIDIMVNHVLKQTWPGQ